MTTQETITLITIASTLFGVFAFHRLAMYRTKRDEISIAVRVFKEAFKPELSAIRNTETNNKSAENGLMVHDFIDSFDRYQTAFNNVFNSIPERDQRKLQKAWDQYCGKDIEVDTETFIAAYSTHHEFYPEFKKRFNKLYSCLDHLL